MQPLEDGACPTAGLVVGSAGRPASLGCAVFSRAAWLADPCVGACALCWLAPECAQGRLGMRFAAHLSSIRDSAGSAH